ncbi:urease accessory protein UreF [Aquabacter spiritensis]
MADAVTHGSGAVEDAAPPLSSFSVGRGTPDPASPRLDGDPEGHAPAMPAGSLHDGEDGLSAPAVHRADPETAPSLLPLFAWLSPSFPVGGYAYSHALEWAVETGDVVREDSLLSWLSDLLMHGFARSDAILLSHAYDAAGDAAMLGEVNALAVALAPSAELRLETCQQGRSFLDAVLAAWPCADLSARAPALTGEVAYPVALGLAAAAHRLPKPVVIEAFLLALVQMLVSAGIRLAPVGQTGGTRIVAALAPDVRRLAQTIPDLTLDDLGTATFRADLGSFRHETQYTRLFRS